MDGAITFYPRQLKRYKGEERNYLLSPNAARNRKGPEFPGLCTFNIFLVMRVEEWVTARQLASQDALLMRAASIFLNSSSPFPMRPL